MKRLPLLYSLLLLALVGGLAFDTGSASAEEDIVINITEEVGIEEFLRVVAKQTGQQLMWDPGDKQIRGKKILGGLSLKAPKAELFARVRALLTFYELVLIPVGPQEDQMMLVMDARRTSSILKLKAQNITLTDQNLATFAGQDGLYVTTTIHVEHMTDLRAARTALSRVVTGQNIGNVTEVADSRAFVVTDFAPNAVAIYRLIKQMDVPVPERKSDVAFHAVSLQNATALETAAVLSRLFPGPRAATKTAPARTGGPSIQADARTNSILVSGKAAEVEQVLQAITVLDQEAPEPEVRAHMLRLSHIPAREATNTLVQLIAGSQRLWRNADDPRSRPAVVSVDRVNALLVSASNSAFEQIRRVVAEMDEAAREDAEDAEDDEQEDGDK